MVYTGEPEIYRRNGDIKENQEYRRTKVTSEPGYIQENQGYIEKNQGYTGEPEIGKNILFIHFVQLKFYPSYAVLTHVL